jgi:hypothetical protein
VLIIHKEIIYYLVNLSLYWFSNHQMLVKVIINLDKEMENSYKIVLIKIKQLITDTVKITI